MGLIFRLFHDKIFADLIPIQNEDEHNSETESLTIKGFNLMYSAQLHIHLV